jgi:hypothetical protein
MYPKLQCLLFITEFTTFSTALLSVAFVASEIEQYLLTVPMRLMSMVGTEEVRCNSKPCLPLDQDWQANY